MKRVDIESAIPSPGGLTPRERSEIIREVMKGRSQADFTCRVSSDRSSQKLLVEHEAYTVTLRLNFHRSAWQLFISPNVDGVPVPSNTLYIELSSEARLEQLVIGYAGKKPETFYCRREGKGDCGSADHVIDEIISEMKKAEAAAMGYLGVFDRDRFRLDEATFQQAVTKWRQK